MTVYTKTFSLKSTQKVLKLVKNIIYLLKLNYMYLIPEHGH